MKTFFVVLLAFLSMSAYAQADMTCLKNCDLLVSTPIGAGEYLDEKIMLSLNGQYIEHETYLNPQPDGSFSIRFRTQRDADNFLVAALATDGMIAIPSSYLALWTSHLAGIMDRGAARFAAQTAVDASYASIAGSTASGALIMSSVAVTSAFTAGYAVGDILVVLDRKYNNGATIDKISRIIFYPFEYSSNKKFEKQYGQK